MRDFLALTILTLALATPAGAGEFVAEDKITIYGGTLMRGVFPGDALIPFGSGFDGNGIIAASAQRTLYRFDNGVQFGVEAGLAARFGDKLTGEAWAGGSIGHRGWSLGKFTFAPAVVAGFSAVTDTTGIEAIREAARGGNATFLFYLGPEIAVRHEKFPNVELVYRLHHRSGGHGTLGNMHEGANANLLGLRFAF